VADPNTRQGKRTPVTLKIKFKSETLEQFIERYAVDVSQGGIFIRTKEPLAVGTQMKFEFQLKDASPLIAGEGTVVWTRENDPSRPAIAPGMGVRFDRLADGSQQVLEKILAEKMKQAPARTTGESTTKPPMFTDTPTRVAPAPVQDALLGPGDRSRRDSEQTPLPNPMPFHSDAEDFDEKAFEEATKVRALDELVAATAAADAAETKEVSLPNDELAARRHVRPETPLAEPPTAQLKGREPMVPDRDSAPGLPSPPEARPPKLLDTTPSPRSAPPMEDPARTKLGLEPAKAATGSVPVVPQRMSPQDRSAIPRPVTPMNEPSRPVAPHKPSSAPIVIAILVVVAAALAGVWYFVLRDNVAEDSGAAKGSGGSAAVAHNPTPPPPPPPQTGSGSAAAMAGSGSAHVMTGSAATAGGGSAAVKPPSGPTVDTIIAASVPNATIEVTGTGLTGPAPYTAKLEKGQTYEVNVTAAGFAPKKVFVTGGQEKATIKLDPKTHVISVTSDPAGAQIFIENVQTGKVTPADVELSAAQASKGKVKVGIRKPGFRPADQMVDSFTDEDTKVTAKVDVKLNPMPVNTGGGRPNGGNTGGGNTAGSAAGSATPPTGSATPPDGTTTPPTGSATAPTEPEPDFNKRQ
jgi:uncharacterized protein (TIGR02266 family)